KELRRLGGQPGAVYGLAYSPDGKWLASVAWDNSAPGAGQPIVLWDAATGKEVRRLRGHPHLVRCLAFAPDGHTLAAAGVADDIRLWDSATGELLRRLPKAREGRTRDVYRVLFSPDGRTLISAEEDGKVLLWEVSTGRLRAELAGHQGPVLGLSVSADGRRLASSGTDTTALVWDLTDRGRPRSPAGGALSARELEALWDDLGSPDAPKAYAAVLRLAAEPGRAAPFLRGRLRPVPRADPDRLARLVSDLGSERFADRERAEEELRKLGEAAEASLRQALTGGPTLEVRRRAERLLAELGPTTAAGLRRLRGVEAVECVGGAAARAALEELAGGAAGARLTEEARAALGRLSKQPVPRE